MKAQVQATLEGLSTRKDGSLAMRFSTQELDTQEKLILLEKQGKFGWLLFDENAFKEADIPKSQAVEGKTPSQRLRAALFVLWEHSDKIDDFETYYRRKMEKLIDWVKDKIEDAE